MCLCPSYFPRINASSNMKPVMKYLETTRHRRAKKHEETWTYLMIFFVQGVDETSECQRCPETCQARQQVRRRAERFVLKPGSFVSVEACMYVTRQTASSCLSRSENICFFLTCLVNAGSSSSITVPLLSCCVSSLLYSSSSFHPLQSSCGMTYEYYR